MKILRTALGKRRAEFRDGQWEAIRAVVEDNKRLLVVQRTGWGKSMVYFLATRLLRESGAGPTLIVSPLLSLMRNQIEAAERGLNVRAATINSSNREDWEAVKSGFKQDEVDVLLISPERLSNEHFLEEFLFPAAKSIGLFVVDEAHCISDWGHDFRPDYRRIVRILRLLPPSVPCLATTATANDRVVADVIDQLGENVELSRGPLARTSLSLQNVVLPDKGARMAWIAEKVPRMPGSGIIYCLTVRDARMLAKFLRMQGLDVRAYYGDLIHQDRIVLEQRLLKNELKALVATTALGMGFDKPDLGFVIHFQRPGSLVHYYQQVGRAGRGVDKAFGILLSGKGDEDITEYFLNTAFPARAHVDQVLRVLENAPDGLHWSQLEKEVNLPYGRLERAVKYLLVESPSPIRKLDRRWYRNPTEYVRDQETIDTLIELRREEQRRMNAYVESRTCLMEFLGRELNDPAPVKCGKCAPCRGRAPFSSGVSPDLAIKARRFLRGLYHVIEPRERWPRGAFESYDFIETTQIDPGLRFERGVALSLWNDDGWGGLVKKGKQEKGAFDAKLVEASARVIEKAIMQDNGIEWVTCIPSLKNDKLVPSFARRLAKRLDLPFSGCIIKVVDNEPQKTMENSWHQARNLDGVFDISKKKLRRGGVLLVDDMVDSRWTFTVASAMLLNAGSGPVFPFALAQSTGRGA